MMEEERWIMQGLDANDPDCIKSVEKLMQYIDETGFLPLFRNEIPGFSVEEHTAADSWWTGDPESDPWEWRKIIAGSTTIAYGKFFDNKAGFISRDWFPFFANYRRDGYDFDARWDDELAGIRSKKIMDLFEGEHSDRELYSSEIKKKAGFGTGGEKNFEGEITRLQMQTYLCIRDFRRRKNKAGEEYGWGIAVYCLPEHLWGYDHVTSQYCREPKDSVMEIIGRVKELYSDVSERSLAKVLGIREYVPVPAKRVLPYPDNLIRALRIEGLSTDTMTDDQKAGLEVAVGQLRDRQQRTIRLKYEEHKKNEEIAKIMNRAPGTIGTYHTKAMGKLRWQSVSVWYLEGYEAAVRRYFAGKGWAYQERPADEGNDVSGVDYCLRLGISLKHFEALYRAGIHTVFDLIAVSGNKSWYKTIKGIGPKAAEDILSKADHLLISRLPASEKESGENSDREFDKRES